MISKPSYITALIGLIVALVSMCVFILNIYFSSEPTSVRVENLIDAVYMLVVSLGFLLISLYFNQTGR